VKNSTKIVLALLHLNPDGITALECLQQGGGFRLSGRVLELRQAGYDVPMTWETTPGGARIGRYRLVTKPEQLRLAV
jgi:hypothetical protein